MRLKIVLCGDSEDVNDYGLEVLENSSSEIAEITWLEYLKDYVKTNSTADWIPCIDCKLS